MNKRLTDTLKTHASALIASIAVAFAMNLTIGVRPVSAGGFTACDAPFIFEGSAANIVPLEYIATSIDSSSARGDRQARLQETAQRFSWLFKLDSWHQPTYGSLGVVAHMFLGGICEPDEVLGMLLAGGASAPLRKGQILVFLQGRIFIEDDQIFVQSRLRGFRRQSHQQELVIPLHGNFAEETFNWVLGQTDRSVSISMPLLDITFAPRVLSEDLFNRIDEAFMVANRVFSEPDVNAASDELVFEPGQGRAFSVRITNEPGWIEVEDMFGGHPNSGYIRVNPEASRLFHLSLPELDFLNGLLGFLRLQQVRASPDFSSVPRSAPLQANAAFERYLQNELTNNEPETRALALGLIGFIQASELGDLAAARLSFLRAAELAPTETHYRNALGVTDAMLCCALESSSPYRDPSRWFADAVSVDPENGEALGNLLHFLEFLTSIDEAPDGIDKTNIPQTLEMVRKVAEQNPDLIYNRK